MEKRNSHILSQILRFTKNRLPTGWFAPVFSRVKFELVLLKDDWFDTISDFLLPFVIECQLLLEGIVVIKIVQSSMNRLIGVTLLLFCDQLIDRLDVSVI